MPEEGDDLAWYGRKADAIRNAITVERVDDDAGRAQRVWFLLGGLDVKHEIEVGRTFDRKVSRLRHLPGPRRRVR
jgi:hypothetical protein